MLVDNFDLTCDRSGRRMGWWGGAAVEGGAARRRGGLAARRAGLLRHRQELGARALRTVAHDVERRLGELFARARLQSCEGSGELLKIGLGVHADAERRGIHQDLHLRIVLLLHVAAAAAHGERSGGLVFGCCGGQAAVWAYGTPRGGVATWTILLGNYEYEYGAA